MCRKTGTQNWVGKMSPEEFSMTISDEMILVPSGNLCQFAIENVPVESS